MRTHHLLTIVILPCIFLAGCSRDYAPDSQSTGEQIFQAACSECHKPDKNGFVYHLNHKNANLTYIAHKAKSGSLMMPAFPKMKADDLKKVGVYVLANSKIE